MYRIQCEIGKKGKISAVVGVRKRLFIAGLRKMTQNELGT